MKVLAIVSCTKSKREGTWPARLLYDKSPLFRYALRYCEMRGYEVCVLSAKYGLVPVDTTLQTYEETLSQFTEEQRQQWARRVNRALQHYLQEGYMFSLHLGRLYRNYLEIPPERIIEEVSNLRIGERLRWYRTHLERTPDP